MPPPGQGRNTSHDDAARASLDELATLPFIGRLIGLILLPRWCYESIVDESVRSGRSAASLVVWALEWSIAMALGISLLLAVGFVVGWPGVAFLTGFAGTFAGGALVGRRTPGLGGLGVGFLGLVIGGAIVGVFAAAVALVGDTLSDREAQAGGALVYIPLMTMLLPVLTGAQFGVGLLVATVVGRRR